MTARDVLLKAARLMEDDDMLGMFSAISEAAGESDHMPEAKRVLREHIGITGSLFAWTRSGITRAGVIATIRAAAGGAS